jgi:hypothetical protein
MRRKLKAALMPSTYQTQISKPVSSEPTSIPHIKEINSGITGRKYMGVVMMLS